jgi:hypothetical protein
MLTLPRGTTPAEPALATAWAKSADGAIAVRLIFGSNRWSTTTPVVVSAELRNESKGEVFVLRPLADTPRLWGGTVAIDGPDGRVRYDYSKGGMRTYRLSDEVLVMLSPGETIRDPATSMLPPLTNFQKNGKYKVWLHYAVDEPSYRHLVESNAKRYPNRVLKLWTGEINTEAIEIIKDDGPAQPASGPTSGRATKPGKEPGQ